MAERIDPELLPCPFCGGKAVIGLMGFLSDQEGLSYPVLTVGCVVVDCDAAIECSFPPDTDHQEMINRAARAWNRRAPVEKKEIP